MYLLGPEAPVYEEYGFSGGIYMAELVPFNPDVHMDEFRQMNIESIRWHSEQLLEKHQIDTVSMTGQSVEEYVDAHLESYAVLKPPEGVVYILLVEGEVAGMAALTKLSDDTGELHRMWINPDCRGSGYSRPLLNKVLEAGRGIGCSTFKLSTPKFAHAAQHLYRSAGFKETGEYQESEVPPFLRQFWTYMEKRE
jgi:N-acetylglutamate synthase-like GNAT family acetyltransferase